MIFANFNGRTAEYRHVTSFIRQDLGWEIPNDGYRYFRVKHAVEMGLPLRNSFPAVAHKSGWGTTVSDNEDYLSVYKEMQFFFFEFIKSMTKGLLPHGDFIGYYTIDKNPGLLFHNYTPGTLEWVYSRMYQDAVWATDAGSFTTGSRDYVLGLNLDSNEDWQYLSGRPCTGALLRLRQDRGSVMRFDCIDSKKPLPDPYKLERWQYYWCTQENRDGTVTRFPHYKEAFQSAGYDFISGTPSPLIAPDGWLEMKKAAVVELPPGTIWKPYKP